jgi:hypothetical protein
MSLDLVSRGLGLWDFGLVTGDELIIGCRSLRFLEP